MLSQNINFLSRTNLSWVSDAPIPNDSNPLNLKEALDKLIDRHLFFLPLKRYCRDIYISTEKSLHQLKDLYKSIDWPHQDIFDGEDFSKQTCIILIACLDLNVARALTKQRINSYNFIFDIFDFIKNEIHSKASSLSEIVLDMIIYKDLKKIKETNTAQNDWLLVKDLEKLNLISSELDTHIDNYLLDYKDYNNHNLKEFLRLESLEDEMPKFGFFFQ